MILSEQFSSGLDTGGSLQIWGEGECSDRFPVRWGLIRYTVPGSGGFTLEASGKKETFGQTYVKGRDCVLCSDPQNGKGPLPEIG